MEKQNQINHIVRNGLIAIVYNTRMMIRQADRILNRCKEMEELLDNIDKEHKNIVIDKTTDNEN